MPEKHRFLILTSDSGFGHRTSANSIAKALILRYPSGAQAYVVNPIFEDSASRFLQRAEENYDSTVKDHPDFYRFAYEISETRSIKTLVESTLTLALHKTLKSLIKEIHPRAIASTNQMFTTPVASVLNDLNLKTPFFTVVTDLAEVHTLWFNKGPDRYFVASDRVRTKAITNGVDPQKVTISGIPVDPDFKLSNITPADMRLRLGLEPNLTTLLIVGSKRVSGIYDSLKALEKVNYPFQVVVIAGGDDELYANLNQHPWAFPIHIENYVYNIPEWMRASDLLITKAGGLILSEGLAAGLPIVLIDYLPGQEEGNVRFILDHESGETVETPEEFYLLIDSWLKEHQKQLKARAKNARNLGRPEAAIVIAEALWLAAEHAPHPLIHYSECQQQYDEFQHNQY